MAPEASNNSSPENSNETSVLEKAIAASQSVVGEGEHGDVDAPLFRGHPADTTPDTTESGAQPTDGDNKKPESTNNEPDASAAGDGPGKNDKPGGDVPPDGDTPPAATPGADTGATPSQFKSIEEATEAYQKLQKLMNRQGTELGELRAQNKRDQDNKAAADAEAELQKEMSEFIKEQNAATLKAINALDGEAEDYDQKVADLWAQKDMAVMKWHREHTSAPVNTAPPAQAPPPSSGGGAPGATSTSTPGNEPPAAGDKHPNVVYAEEQAKAAGLDPADPVFKGFIADVKNVDEKGNARSLEDMVQEIVSNTKAYHDKQRSDFEKDQEAKAAELAAKHQNRNQPMDTSAAVRTPSAPPTEEKRSIGIGGALDAVSEERRL